MDKTKEIIPVFREQKHGTIINVASMGGRVSFPFYSIRTKWAVEGFSESLQYELRAFNIKIKIVEPGVIETDFYGRSMDTFQDNNVETHDGYLQSSKKKMGSMKGSKHGRIPAFVSGCPPAGWWKRAHSDRKRR